jgi:putative ABC transport system substrate-binding protein
MSFQQAEHMRRREFIALAGASVAWPFAALAQEPGRTYHVGGLSAIPRKAPLIAAMFDELRRFGFIEGQNLTIDWRQYTLHVDQISEYAAELVNSKVDVIYASGDAAIRAVQRATTTIPILGTTDDMVESGLVQSLARPEGNCPDFAALPPLPIRTEPLVRGFRHSRRRHKHATLTFRFTKSPNPRKSQQLSTLRRRRVQQR